jgi:hypothetical protein
MSDQDDTLRERTRGWLDLLLGRKKPEPKPAPTPTPPSPSNPPRLLELWRSLRGLSFKELAPALVTVPVIVFLAISGFVMWCVLVLKFIASLIRTALGL